MTEKVVIDTRESSAVYNIAKKVLKEFEVVNQKLEVGDIEFGSIIIERKTPNDFINSVKRPSFWTNLFIMKDYYEHPFLYIDGDIDDWIQTVARGSTPYSSIEGSMTSVLLTGIPIISFAKLESAFHRFNAMFNKVISSKSPATAKLSFSKTKANLHKSRVECIMCIPRLGNIAAEKLLKEHGSILNLIKSCKGKDTPVEKKIYDFYCEEEIKENGNRRGNRKTKNI